GARTDEYVHAMRSLWNDDHPSFKGKFVSFDNVRAEPRPVQVGGPPIIVGGSSNAAIRRTVEYAQGWYGFALNVDQTRDVLRRLQEAGATDIEISVTPSVPINDDTVQAFSDIGVDRLISLVSQRSIERVKETIDAISTYAS
ncbi:MAG TPA: LLM class flavin-dependent oxidoreductase, partial [Gammaproteobacteria bacterium]|nr:LLM class flavin-dependent oxidoreductase [Gammaproteobacteria bacterium]